MLTLLTATGARPEAWRLCQRWMERQTYAGPVRWVVVDDGREAQEVRFERRNWCLEVVRPSPFWRLGENTQARNLLAGLELIEPGARVVVVEDDDWYANDWLEHVERMLVVAELVGEIRARYYHVGKRLGREHTNTQHSSLCSTAMRGQALETFRQACETHARFIDLELWKSHDDRHLFAGHRVVGIKGLPGRGGIGMGHAGDFRGRRDPAGRLLAQWIGADDAKALFQVVR